METRKIESECPVCHTKNVSEISHTISQIAQVKWVKLSCGHSYKIKLELTKKRTIVLDDGKELYPYQFEGFKFAEQSNFNCLIADEQGLGKTIQAIAVLHEHLDILKPTLVICKASLTLQWQRHILLEIGKFAQVIYKKDDPIVPCPVYIISFDMVSKIDWTKFKPAIKSVIVDECQYIKNHEAKRTQAVRDLIKRKVTKSATIVLPKDKSAKVKKAEMMAADLFKWHGIEGRFKYSTYRNMGKILGLTKCKVRGEGIIEGEIILNLDHIERDREDEILETILHEIAHAITPGAGHVRIWQETSLSIGGNGQAIANCSGSVELTSITYDEPIINHKIFLSGTPILNNAIEYFPVLNMLDPNLFYNRDKFIREEVGFYQTEKGTWKAGGIKYPKQFKEKTKHIIIRRRKKDVLPDLPTITRDYRYHEILDDETEAYNQGVKKLEDFLNSANPKGFNFTSDLQGHIMILRHITGLAKIRPILDYIEEFVEANEGKKLAVFAHHIDVCNILAEHLCKMNIQTIKIDSTMDVTKRTELLDEFRTSETKNIMIAPTLAMGEGYDLEFCETAILLEREWNPAKEEQVEGRFIRATPESIERAKKGDLKVTLVYPVAVNTIDEFFAELVERKRQYVTESLDGSANKWNESDIMLELAKIAVQRWKNQ